MFPVETFNAIKGLAQEAQLPTRTKLNSHTLFQYVPGKEPTFELLPPDAVHRQIHRLEDFLTFLTARKDGGFVGNGITVPDGDIPNVLNVANEGSVVYFNATSVKYEETPGDLRGMTAKMDMVMTPEMKWLMTDSARDYSHKDFVRVLRITLRNCLPPTNLLSIIRDAKFSTNSTAASVQAVTRQSFGRDVQAEVIGLQAIPEEVTLSVQPFENMKNKFSIQCAIEIEASAPTFRLTPFPGQLVDAIDGAMSVVSCCINDIVPAYYGRTE